MSCSPTTILAEAGCVACLSLGQQQAMIVRLLCEILQAYDADNPMATCDAQTILDESECLTCLTPQQLSAMTVKLLCDIKDATLGGVLAGGGSVLCGDTDPVDAPTTDCAFYYNYDTQDFWYWNPGTASWDKYLDA